MADLSVEGMVYAGVYGILGRESGLGSIGSVSVAFVAFLVSSIYFSRQHDQRILYADRIAMSAFKYALVQLGLFVCGIYFFGLGVSAIGTLALYGAMLPMLGIWWLIARKILKRVRSLGVNYRSAVIIGEGDLANAVLEEIESDAGYGYRMLSFFSDRPDLVAPLRRCLHPSELKQFVESNKTDAIYYARENIDRAQLEHLLEIADSKGIEISVVPPLDRMVGMQFSGNNLGRLVTLSHTLSPLNSRVNKALKRGLDVGVSIVALALTGIISIPVAISIKVTSPGPVFFRQRRTGWKGQEFTLYKFRTMKVESASDRAVEGVDDPRKTKVGAFLRRTSLDELPQFFNVLAGQMSVVGPRPHMLSETRHYTQVIPRYMVRHAVKPGITGWAQVNGFRGGTVNMDLIRKRVAHDMWYIRNWNLFLDLKIMLLTVLNALRGDKNAY